MTAPTPRPQYSIPDGLEAPQVRPSPVPKKRFARELHNVASLPVPTSRMDQLSVMPGGVIQFGWE